MKKLFYLVILGAGIIGCTSDTEGLNELNDFQEFHLTSEVEGFTTTSLEFLKEKKNGNDYFGTLHVTNDCENLYIQLEDADDVNLGLYEDSEGFPTINPNGKVPNGLDLTADDSVDLLWTFPLSDFSGNSISIFANTANIWVGDIEYGDALYFNYEIQVCEVEEEDCESGYMIGNKDFSDIGTSQNWGWAHQFDFNEENGSETREIHQKNGSLGGEVTISYDADSGEISVEEGEGVKISHLYISNQEPTETNAPGQFDKEQSYDDEDGIFWVMVKAEVCE